MKRKCSYQMPIDHLVPAMESLGGQLWSGAGIFRVYFGDHCFQSLLGISYDESKKSTPAHLRFRGEIVSELEASELYSAMTHFNLYYDLTDLQWGFFYDENSPYAHLLERGFFLLLAQVAGIAQRWEQNHPAPPV